MSAHRFERVAVVICDSVGCGNAPDAAAFGDHGANTLAHVIEMAQPALPNLARLGLDRIPGVPALRLAGSGGSDEAGFARDHARPQAAWGRMTEVAPAKDTTAGHWELMGVMAEGALPTYPDGFPDQLIATFERRVGRGVLGNVAASGVEIIDRLGAEHVASGKLIVYTSADSVFQIAAHEEVFALEQLYAICQQARDLLQGEHGVGRVIARPFTGDPKGGFERTSRRRDFSLPPPGRTALDRLHAAGIETLAVGKIFDIFAGQGIGASIKTGDNEAGIDATRQALLDGRAQLIFTNLVDFDTLYGHRNDPHGYATALERLDESLPRLLDALTDDACLILTADHGNDPTYPGTDHTRERVPLLVVGPGVEPVDLGDRQSFADVGSTLLDNFGVEGGTMGESFLSQIAGGRTSLR